MSISIVTVTLDAGKDLPLTIESVRQQDYGEVELVVVDGGSRDATARILERYADAVDRVVRAEDASIYHAMNIALDHCHNDYVLFLNAEDTLFSATTLSRLVACKRPDVDVFFGNHVYVNSGREYLKKSEDFDMAARQLFHGRIDHRWLARRPGHQATFVRGSLLRKLRFDTRVEICADHDLLMRAYAAGASFQYIDETVSHYYGGGFSAQRPDRLMLEWCALYREYSILPEAVDQFFLGETASPFGSQNALLGSFVTGDYPRGKAVPKLGIVKPVKWCRADGLRLRAPPHGSSSRVRLEGFNQCAGQSLTLFHGSEIIATLDLDVGWFDATVDFASEVPPSAIVEISAFLSDEISEDDRRFAGFALAFFGFEGASDYDLLSDVDVLKVGDTVLFSARNRAVTKPMLGAGWSTQEHEHIWTVEETAELRLRLAPNVEQIVLRCLGNPFVADPQERGAEVAVDGRDVGRHLLPNEAVDVVVPCAGASRRGVTKVNLRALCLQSSPDDVRTLGVCLLSVACR